MKQKKQHYPEVKMFYEASHYIFNNATKNRNNLTESELAFWNEVKGDKLGCRFRRQHPIGEFIADFYCHKYLLVVEIDGEYHDDPDQKRQDLYRTNEIERCGIKIIRFTNYQVLHEIESVITTIKEFIHQRQNE